MRKFIYADNNKKKPKLTAKFNSDSFKFKFIKIASPLNSCFVIKKKIADVQKHIGYFGALDRSCALSGAHS